MAATSGFLLLPTTAQAAIPGGVLGWGSDTPFQGLIAGTLPGQLCDGGAADQPAPVAAVAPVNANVTAISTQKDHTLVLSTTGTVYACGLNRFGQLGDGTIVNKTVPVAVAAPAGVAFSAVSAGWDHSLALSTTGTVWSWGQNSWGQLGLGTQGPGDPARVTPFPVNAFPAGTVITAIAAGGYFSLALDSTGQVWSWGYNGNGELGQGFFPPPLVVALPGKVAAPANAGVTAIAAGADHGLALIGGAVFAWGLNNFGQLGDGTLVNRASPVAAAAPANAGVTAIAAGGAHSLAIIGGAVWGWGRNNKGQLGNGGAANSAVPVAAAAPANAGVTAIAAGWQHSVALTNTGAVLAWGWGKNGQLGAGPAGCPPNCADSLVPVGALAPANAGVSLIAAGYSHSVAVK